MSDHALIYMDHNATTPVDPRVIEAMLPFFRERIGNASSRSHDAGRSARQAVEAARQQAADLIGADARDIVWTSGATEGNNLALRGVARFWAGQPVSRGRHIVTTSIEHPSVMEVCQLLAQEGFEITFVDPEPGGFVAAEAIDSVLRDDTLLVSAMWANNETGVINDIAGIGAACKRRGIHFHCDATQAIGKVSVDVEAAHVDLLTWSAHKHYGPQGVGAIYLRRRDPRVRLLPLLVGGGQERGIRSGTLNVPGIVGLGKACALCGELLEREARRLATLRDRLESRLLAALPTVQVNGDPARRLPQTTNLSFGDLEAQRLMAAMPRLAVSSGAACSSESLESSRVLRRMGLSPQRARSSLRFSIGRDTTEAQIDDAAAMVIASASELERLPANAPTAC